jgi:hypothetical protein
VSEENEDQLCLIRASVASVSRHWQLAIERLTFRDIESKSTNLDSFGTIVVGRHHRTFLQKFQFYVVLPKYSDEACAI